MNFIESARNSSTNVEIAVENSWLQPPAKNSDRNPNLTRWLGRWLLPNRRLEVLWGAGLVLEGCFQGNRRGRRPFKKQVPLELSLKRRTRKGSASTGESTRLLALSINVKRFNTKRFAQRSRDKSLKRGCQSPQCRGSELLPSHSSTSKPEFTGSTY